VGGFVFNSSSSLRAFSTKKAAEPREMDIKKIKPARPNCSDVSYDAS
jgi:hypothetical protein